MRAYIKSYHPPFALVFGHLVAEVLLDILKLPISIITALHGDEEHSYF